MMKFLSRSSGVALLKDALAPTLLVSSEEDEHHWLCAQVPRSAPFNMQTLSSHEF